MKGYMRVNRKKQPSNKRGLLYPATRIILSLLWIFQGSALGQYHGGSGTAEDPYLIYTADQMNSMGLHPAHWTGHFKLMADIDLSDFTGESFNLIGTTEVPFAGVFHGNGHKISNFTYHVYKIPDPNDPAESDIRNNNFGDPDEPTGLFRMVSGPDALITNVCLVNPDIGVDPSSPLKSLGTAGALIGYLGGGTVSHCAVQGGRVRGAVEIGGLVGRSVGGIFHCDVVCEVSGIEKGHGSGGQSFMGLYVGGVVGDQRGGRLSRCTFNGNVSGIIWAGGLVGSCQKGSRISQCSATGSVSGERKNVGGLAGENKGTIENCHSDMSVSQTKSYGDGACGGLVGSNSGTISDCHASGPVLLSTVGGGGLIGKNGGLVTRCHARGSVSGGLAAGGLIGKNGGPIEMSYAWGNVSGSHKLGGFIGQHVRGDITDCYAWGDVSGPNDVGGLVGRLQGGRVYRCYARGHVQGQMALGGLIGSIPVGQYIPVERCFWAMKSGHPVQSAGGVGLDIDQMFDRDTYVSAGWDFAGETVNGIEDLWYLDMQKQMSPVLAFDVEPELIVVYDLANDPGWTMEGPWQFGSPLGLGGVQNGYPDPNSGYTGSNVMGVNLQGDYDILDKGPHYLTTGPIDCSAYSHVRLQFARWLNSDEADYTRVFIEVSTDRITWHPVWDYEDMSTAVTDDAWQVVSYPLSSQFYQQPQVYVRWGYHILDDESWAFSGWNIDDIQVMGLR